MERGYGHQLSTRFLGVRALRKLGSLLTERDLTREMGGCWIAHERRDSAPFVNSLDVKPTLIKGTGGSRPRGHDGTIYE